MVGMHHRIVHQRTVRVHTPNATSQRLKSLFFGKDSPLTVLPTALTFVQSNRLALADTAHARVLLVDLQGTIRKELFGSKSQPFLSPTGLCVDSRERLWVADSQAHSLFIFSKRLRFQRIIPNPSKSRITGIAIVNDRVFAVDVQNHRLLFLNLNGAIEKIVGGRGKAPGLFNFPTHIAADSSRIAVVDAMNFRVQVFDQEGNWQFLFGRNGNRSGDFSKPKGIALDSAGRFYVLDAMFDNFQIFNSRGQFLTHVGMSGKGHGEFWMPSGVVIDSSGAIWVADTYNRRLQVFEVEEGQP